MGKTNFNTTGQLGQKRLIAYAPYIFVGAILIIVPPFLPSFLQSLVTKCLILGIFAMSLDLIFGYAGLWSLGHAAYFGTAGYVFGILVSNYGVDSFWIAAPLGILAATLLAAFFGLFVLRVSGLYFMMVTFAISMLLYSLAWVWYPMTGGWNGLPIPRPNLGIPWFTWTEIDIYYLVFVTFAISFFILYRIVNSPFGKALKGTRDDEGRMRHLGYNTWKHKYIAFIIAGLFAGVAGVLWAPYQRLVTPSNIGFFTSVLGMLYVIIGGTATIFGAAIGVGVIVFLEFGASLYSPERWPLILGIVFVVVIMLLRGGIAPQLVRLWNKAISKRNNYGGNKS